MVGTKHHPSALQRKETWVRKQKNTSAAHYQPLHGSALSSAKTHGVEEMLPLCGACLVRGYVFKYL